jgi:hypothetical protein
MTIDAALLGTVVREAELRTSAAGKPWTSVVRSGDGDAAHKSFGRNQPLRSSHLRPRCGAPAAQVGRVDAGALIFIDTGRSATITIKALRRQRPGLA